MDPDFAVTCPLVRRRRPLIQFLYIGPYLCSTLPSAPPHGDALALCYASTPSGWDGTFTRSCRPCAAYKQKAPGMVGGLLGQRLLVVWRLKDDLGDDLDVAGFARADRARAVEVANGAGDLAEAAGSRADPCCRACWGYWGSRRANAADGANSGCKVDAIQEVEEVCSKLDFDPLGDWDVLDKRQVHIPKTRPGKFVSREVCRAWAGCRQRRVRIREAERSGVPPLLAKARIERMADRCVRIAD